ncbi:MAG TPA: DUF5667 domain-containing protein, partial [Roseiflexaceae bacterium]|nr:DUF5667 domain-containing protein [Roseiflexaceae bacterium]
LSAGESIEETLDAHPKHAPALDPLLQAATALQAAAATSLPAELEAWLSTGAREFTAIAERMAPRYTRRRPMVLRSVPLQRAAVAATLVVGMLGVADIASAASLPGDALYTWKRAKEDITLSLTSDPNALISLHATYAERRLTELDLLTAPNEPVDPALVEEATQSLVDHVEAAISEAQQTGNADTGPITDILTKSRNVLPQAASAAPEASAPLLDARDQLAALAPQVPTPTTGPAAIAEPPTVQPSNTATTPPDGDDDDTGGPVAIGDTEVPNDGTTPLPGQPTSTPADGVVIDPASPTSGSVLDPTAVPTELPAGTPIAETSTPEVPPSEPPDDDPSEPLPTRTPLPPSATSTPPQPTATNTIPPTSPPTPTAVPTEPPGTPLPPPTQPPPPTRDRPTPRPTKTPTPPPTKTPTPEPTDTPVTPTDTPVTPTDTPEPTDTPVTPTDTPVTPTDTPVTPTDTPVTPLGTPASQRDEPTPTP